MNDLKITIIQSSLHWENKEMNLIMFSQKINAITESTDLIILPEMFTTGFSMSPKKFAEPMDGTTVSWMQEKAKEKNCVITGSFICEENGNCFNRLVWVKPDGSYSTYDKRHLFRMANENAHYSAGQKRIIVELNGWKICPLICYDLRFPVWSRNKLVQGSKEETYPGYEYDLLIYVANWPEVRSYPWKTLLLARAIENQSYVVGLNRVGSDGNKIYHSGDSAMINARGEIISKIEAQEESTETITLNHSELLAYRKSFPATLDADAFEITN
ncbi:MAG: amidohydrolase [Bacteroidetes bacterium]|nr:amidohydrolase [Bacteroidota bacterium]